MRTGAIGTSDDSTHMIPPSSACSESSTAIPSEVSVVSSVNSTEPTDSDIPSDIDACIDETELGEFLMETLFESQDEFFVADLPEFSI